MKKQLLILLLCFTASYLSAALKFEKQWEYSQGNTTLPNWIGANTERSMSIYNSKLYIVSRNGGNKILVLNKDGSLEKTITMTGLAAGTLKGNNIGITSDGKILVGTAGDPAFNIQIIDENTGAATSLLSSPASNVLNGGRIDGWGVHGTLTNGYIVVPVSYVAGTTNGGNEILIFKLKDGAVQNSTNPVRISNINGVGASAFALNESHFYSYGKGFSPVLFTKDTETVDEWNPDVDQFAAIKPGSLSVGGAQFSYQGRKYFVSPGSNTYGALEIFDITDGLAQATLAYTTLALGNVANNFSFTCPVAVDVQADGATVFVLGTNNGIAAYRLFDSNILSGTYKVGTGGDYTTLSEAITDIRARKTNVAGNIVLEIISNITESSNLPLGLDLSPYTLTICPDKDEDRTITFASTSANTGGIPGALLLGVDALNVTTTTTTKNIIIDGYAKNGSTKRLTITTAATAATANHPVTIYGDVSNVAIKNCIIKHGVTITAASNNYGICLRRLTGQNIWPSAIVIENNELTNTAGPSSDGISVDLNSSGGTGSISGLIIRNNTIHARARGIIVGYMDSPEISGNTFVINQSSNGLTSACLLGFSPKGNVLVKGNKFISLKTANTTANQGFKAIVTDNASATWYIDNNFFTGFEKTSTSGSSTFFGIDCVSPAVIRHNTFLLNKMANPATVYTAVNIKAGIQPEIKNNIFVSNEDTGTNTFISGISGAVSDYNLFYFDASNTKTTFDGTNKTLASYQSGTNKDQNSKFAAVSFVNPAVGDLHLANTAINDPNLLVPRIAGVLTDIDGDAREIQTYAGADVPLVPVIATPTAISATNLTQTGFTARWTQVSGISLYKINVYTKNPVQYIWQNKEVNATSFDVTDLNPLTDYYYTVSASDGTFNSALSNEVAVRTLSEPVAGGVELPNFVISPYFNEQVLAYTYNPNIRIEVNAPPVESFDPAKPTAIVMYGLPNGNTTDWTIGKLEAPGDDWHYQIQHIGAQTRYLRSLNLGYNLVTVYMEAAEPSIPLSWGTWRDKTTNANAIIKEATENVMSLFAGYQPYIVLSGHSGGGNFPFGFMDAVTEIPSYVKRISFLDSNYNWDNTRYGSKLKQWLEASPDNRLSVIAYNDSIALYNGAPVVSATGGTWYRSRVMQRYLEANMSSLTWTKSEDANLLTYRADNNRIQFLLKQNPTKAILHTVLVEKNGYIQSLLSGTALEQQGYTFYGNHAYDALIQSATVYPHILRIPPRKTDAIGGAAFMDKVKNMSIEDREMEIYKEISSGNIPNSHRKATKIVETLQDANTVNHTVEYQVMPDFLAIGNDNDFCRIPMLPGTAQRLATLFGASLPTPKISDLNHKNAILKMEPKTMTPDASMTTVPVFIAHNTFIEEARVPMGKPLSDMMAGHKKDIVICNSLASKPTAVFIYGWHYPNGTPIQPVYGGHAGSYTDYSHGTRMVNQEVMVDGVNTKIRNILQDLVKYKLLSNETGIMTQIEYPVGAAPEAPKVTKSFAIVPVSDTSVEVILNPVASANYKVLYGTDVANLNQSLDLDTESPVIEGLTAGELYYFAIQSSNAMGTSPISEKLAAVTSTDKINILLVNGFDRNVAGNTFDFVKEHGKAIKTQSYPFASATNDAVIDGLVNLNDYLLVDYILGEESTADRTFNTNEQTLIKAFLQGGGSLLATGAEIGWDLDRPASDAASKEFIRNYLKCIYAADNPTGGVGLYHNAKILSGVSFGDDNYPFTFADGVTGTSVQYPDVFKPETGAIGFIQYFKGAEPYDVSNGYAGIAYSGMFSGGTKEGKVIVMGIPFESIYPENSRTEIMKRLLAYFAVNTSVGIEPAIVTDSHYGKIYPNPAKEYIKISLPENQSEMIQVTILDITGRVVLKENTQSNKVIPVAHLSNGNYIVRINCSGQTFKSKLIINRY